MESETVFEAFSHSADRWPERDMLVVLPATAAAYAIEPGSISYRSMHEQALDWSHRFEAQGYVKGMRVALLLENRPVFFILWLALNRLGISVVPINPDLRASELEYLIGHAEPALVITTEQRKQELLAASQAAGINSVIITPDDKLSAPQHTELVADRLGGQQQEAAVLYTSGTTGDPKGCVLPNSYYLLAGQWYANVGGIATLNTNADTSAGSGPGNTPGNILDNLHGERMLTPLPIFHMNAMAYSFMAMVTVGGCLCVLDRFHPSSWWSDVAAAGATCLHYLGVMPSMLMNAEPSPADTAHAIRFGFGAGVDPKLQAGFEQRFGFPLVEAWAMTETGAGAVVAASTNDRLIGHSCLGKPASDVECLVIDENGKAVDRGAPGELLVRHGGADPRYGFFSKYYKNAEATEQAWLDGWFHTGDIVRQDEYDNLYFVDRKKNVIRRSGENIAAVEVESVLMRHPAIHAAGVAAVPDAIRGDEVFACLKVDTPSEKTALDIVQWGLAQMAYYKVPGYIAFVDQLPLTATQKIQRAELKKQALELLDDPATITTVQLKKRQTVS